MTRKKKSRKPSAAPTRLSKQEKQQLADLKDKKPKKLKGKRPGNKQQEARENSNAPQQEQRKKDPRIGSKKPIVLGKTQNQASAVAKSKPKSVASPRVAPIREVENLDNTAELNEELRNIEQDESLQVILSKQEQDLVLTEQEIDYFNQLMDRHQTISEKLGLTDDDEEDNRESSKDDDALWDTLDKQDFSDYQ